MRRGVRRFGMVRAAEADGALGGRFRSIHGDPLSIWKQQTAMPTPETQSDDGTGFATLDRQAFRTAKLASTAAKTAGCRFCPNHVTTVVMIVHLKVAKLSVGSTMTTPSLPLPSKKPPQRYHHYLSRRRKVPLYPLRRRMLKYARINQLLR